MKILKCLLCWHWEEGELGEETGLLVCCHQVAERRTYNQLLHQVQQNCSWSCFRLDHWLTTVERIVLYWYKGKQQQTAATDQQNTVSSCFCPLFLTYTYFHCCSWIHPTTLISSNLNFKLTESSYYTNNQCVLTIFIHSSTIHINFTCWFYFWMDMYNYTILYYTIFWYLILFFDTTLADTDTQAHFFPK